MAPGGVASSGAGRADIFVGLDLGTSRLKALAVNAGGATIATASADYPLYSQVPGYAEEDVGDWWAALASAMNQLWQSGVSPGRVAAIGISGQMHGLVLLDHRLGVLGRCQTWADSRCQAQARTIGRRFPHGRFASITGSVPNASATASKLLWVRRYQPDRWAEAAHMLLPKDYLRLRLTGDVATDVTDACGTLLCDVRERDWSIEVLETLRIPPTLLPRIVESPTVVGQVSPEAARTLGLRAGTPVVAGAGDAECAAVGLGVTGMAGDTGAALISIGTAAQLFAPTDAPLDVASYGLQSLCHALPGRWHVMGALLAGGSTLEWLAEALAGPAEQPVPVSRLLNEAAREPPGAGGLLFLPHLRGTRMPVPDPTPQGAFIGLRSGQTRATLARAVVEGVAVDLAGALAAVRNAGIPVREVRMAGGAQRHPLWPRVLADALGVPVLLGTTHDGSALGAAMLSAVGVGALSWPRDGADVRAHKLERIEPDAATTALYEKLANVARRATSHLHSEFRALRAFS